MTVEILFNALGRGALWGVSTFLLGLLAYLLFFSVAASAGIADPFEGFGSMGALYLAVAIAPVGFVVSILESIRQDSQGGRRPSRTCHAKSRGNNP